MKTWKQVADFLLKHDLPYRLESREGGTYQVLVDAFTGKAVAFTVKEVEDFFK